MGKTAAFLLLLAAAALGQAPPDEEAIRARLPKHCGHARARQAVRFSEKGPPPTALQVVQAYGPLEGPLAEVVAELGEVDLVFDTDLCEVREWEGVFSGVPVEVTEYLLCGEPVEVEVVRHFPADPLAGIEDGQVAAAVYAVRGQAELEVPSGPDLHELLALVRTRSLDNRAETATRALRLKDGTLRSAETSEAGPAPPADTGLTLRLANGSLLRFGGHARTGEFERFYNPEIYPFLARLCKKRGLSPPGE